MISTKGLAALTDPMLARLRGLVRRMVATATSGALWQLAGVRGTDGAAEVVKAEVFPGVGFAARPPASATAEVVVVNVDGKAGAPAIIATRDEKTAATARAAVGGLDPGDALVYGDGLVVHVDASAGAVEVRTNGGTAVALATLADLQALRAWLITHVHPDPSSGSTGTPTTTPPTPDGTSTLKGE